MTDYARLKAERQFLGPHEPLPTERGSDEYMAVVARTRRRLEIDNQLADLEIARLRQERFNMLAAEARDRDGW